MDSLIRGLEVEEGTDAFAEFTIRFLEGADVETLVSRSVRDGATYKVFL
jgi:hypothetical protein